MMFTRAHLSAARPRSDAPQPPAASRLPRGVHQACAALLAICAAASAAASPTTDTWHFDFAPAAPAAAPSAAPKSARATVTPDQTYSRRAATASNPAPLPKAANRTTSL
ncbi:hypothetical protein ACHMW6_05970 [Pseudoduganella sp. UC29_106]|uniref:hypothetical protein n=1 Tax=Pseudoduganella sp. UC29_106 TaxID=3374553 RepID=UPI003756A5DA